MSILGPTKTAMATPSKTLFGEEPGRLAVVGDVLAPIVIGAAVGLGTGVLIWMMAVVRFGLEGWL